MNINRHRILFKMLAVLLLAGLALTLFHHHADGQHTNDCAVCRLAAQIFCIVVIAALLGIRMISRGLPAVSLQSFSSLLFIPNLLGRAPPSFS